MKTLEEALQKSKKIYDVFMEVRKEFPNVKLQKSGDDFDYNVFFIGNKTVGSSYDLTAWKDVPILSNCIRRYANHHPTLSGQHFLDMRLNFRGQSSSEDWQMSDDELRIQCRKSFDRASVDFLVNEI